MNNYEQTAKYLENLEGSRNFDGALELAKSLFEHCKFLNVTIEHKDEIIEQYVKIVKDLLERNEKLLGCCEMYRKSMEES